MPDVDAALVLQLSADVNSLTKQMAKATAAVDAESGKMEVRAKKAAHNIEQSFAGANVGEAIEKTFSRARLAVFEEGGAKVGVFGNALEALGPAGLAAAGGIAAVAIAAEQARKALEFADDVDRTAKALGVSTDALQEFDYAAIAMSVGVGKGREALASFNETFGKYSAGLAPGKVGKFLDALGFTPESARQITDVSTAVEKAMLALAKLPTQQRAGLAAPLGLTALLPVIGEGTEGVEKFIAKLREAQTVGAVISPEQIRTAAELNDQIETLQYRIGQDLKSAFIGLGPVLEGATALLAGVVHALAGIAEAAPHAGQALGALLAQASGAKQQDIAAKAADAVGAVVNQFSGGVLGGAARGLVYSTLAPPTPKKEAEPEQRQSTPGLNLAKPKTARTKASHDGEFDKAATEAVDTANRDLAKALASLTGSIDARAGFERQAIEAERDKTIAALNAEEKKIQGDGTISSARKATLIAELEGAKATQGWAALAKETALNQKAIIEAQHLALESANSIRSGLARERQAEGQLEPDANKRADANLDAFVLNQKSDRASQVQQLGDDVTLRGKSQDTADDELTQGDATRAAELAAKRDAERRAANPLYSEAHPLASLNDDLQKAAAQGLDNLNQGLTDAITGAKSLGDAFHDISQSIVADLVKIAVQRAIIAPLAEGLGSLFGPFGNIAAPVTGKVLAGAFASGTDNAPGGLSLVGERGPELLNVPKGAQVIPNNVLSGLRNIQVPNLSHTVVSPSITVHVDANGAFSYAHVQAAVNAGISQAAPAIKTATIQALALRQRFRLP